MAPYFTLRSLVTTCTFALSIPVAVISAAAGQLSWLAIPVAYVVICDCSRRGFLETFARRSELAFHHTPLGTPHGTST